ncbi:MAG: efflux RND transporter permease subunit [Myxacorys chilensis ATA2-1-KO14]|jgi:HAE1 family hydrophobic/amphiphilic exporter-1|nr:efflux RND transporter permease subunit [Myxacorys chilensis ATA2-1-KO14]
MFADFFIKRPVFATVCSLIVLIAGAVSLPLLPIEQYPDISPVQVAVVSNYQGASADVVEKTVTSLLERQINGVEGMRYMTSISSNDGTSQITVTFEPGRNKDLAAVDVQNRVSLAEPTLPEPVRQTGVRVSKQSSSIVLGMGIYGDKGQYDNIFLSNYADLYVLDRIKRIPGVGNVQPFGERRYAMRIWLDPSRLASRALTAQDVVSALQEQNIQVGAGQIGQPPVKDDQMFQIDLIAQSRLTTKEEFEDLTLKTGSDGTLVKLKDIGRAELGAESYTSFSRYNGFPSFGMGVNQLPGSNALAVAHAVKQEMEKASKDFLPGMTYAIPYDPTLFVEESRREVIKTLYEAIILVVITIFVFIQDWRATLIPTITIPISLIGTFAIMKVFGFTFNSLSLFGITLATGLVVDDAIIVIENIDRLMKDHNMPPLQAASEAMREVTGAVIATSLVLMAVFVPVAFFPGTTGALYKQFALTIAFSVVLSTFNALTLTPALSALLLKGETPNNRVFRAINRGIDAVRNGYRHSLGLAVRLKYAIAGLFVTLLCVTGVVYLNTPTAFLPEEDQGYFINVIQGPDGTSINHTRDVIAKVEQTVGMIKEEVAGTFALGGFSTVSGNSANNGIMFVPLKPWDERRKAEQASTALIDKVRGPLLGGISNALVIPINPPTIQGLGSVGGFTFELQDRGDNGIDKLVEAKNQIVAQAGKRPELKGVFTTFSASMPQLKIDVDRNKAKALGIPLSDIFGTLQTNLGGRYVNDFNLFNRSYRVYVQADSGFRSNPDDIGALQVRTNAGQMVPLSNLVKITPTTGAQVINHYNLFPSIEINGVAAPGFSSGQAIKAMEQVAAEVLPKDMGYEWSGISLEEQTSGGLAPLIFGLGLVFVFLVLAAQYENFIDPVIILLSVPLAILGALLAQKVRGFSNDVYCQIGLVMLIGLASKNAILIVEFANQLRERGLSITKAAIAASESRLRPILMTSLSFVLGLVPMMLSSGAGAVSRQSLGTAVNGGMILSTLLSLFIVPVLYILISTGHEHLNKQMSQRLGKRSSIKEPLP